jgi:tetratricopeptide (TPR) repeat protein
MIVLAGALSGAQSKPTVRHSRVPEQTVSPKVTAGEAAMDRKDWAAAETALKQATAEDPRDYRAWFDLASVYTQTNRKPEAVEAYRQCVAAKPDLFESNLNLGLLLAQTGAPDAEQFLRAATRLKPQAEPEKQLARAWMALGVATRDKDTNTAIAAFQQAAKLSPTDAQPHLAAAQLLVSNNDMDAAAREYNEALTLDPESTAAAEGLARVNLKANRLPEGESALRQLLERDPGNFAAHLELSKVLVVEKKLDDAAVEADAALKLRPNDPAARRQAIAIATQRKQYAQAVQLLKTEVAQHPNDAELRYQLGTTLRDARNFREAQDELLKSVQLKPDLADAYGDLAVVANENQNYPLALKALEFRAKYLPEVPATYFLRATAYDHLRQQKLAIQNYHRFLDAANGKYPDEEWKARHRLIALEPKK